MEMMQRLRWLLVRQRLLLGRVGSTAVFVMLVCLAILLLYIWPLTRSVTRLDSQSSVLERTHQQGGAQQPDSPAEQLLAFYRLLPTVQQIPDVVTMIHASAAKQGIDLNEAQLKLDIDPGSRVGRYQMTFPVKAGYGATRDFVREVMHQIPAIALEEMSFQRADPASNVTEARVQFALYVLATDGADRSQ